MPAETPVDVVVPVHNSPHDVQACLTSIAPTLGDRHRLIVVDDGSEEETRRICEASIAEDPARRRLIRRPEGSGFCRAANHGLRESRAEVVVVLNSDTIVSPGWLESINRTFDRNAAIGLVGPLSNAASWQSLPRTVDAKGRLAVNPVSSDPEKLSAIQEYLQRFAEIDPPFVELINGFCFCIRRPVIEKIGYFDEENFPKGYGEETDYCFRAQDAGFLLAVCTQCFVYHSKSKSYGAADRARLTAEGHRRLESLYGAERIDRAVKATRCHPTLKLVRGVAEKTFAARRWLR